MVKQYHLLALEGLRFLRRRIRVARSGVKKYSGSAEQICKQVIEDCWNGKYFQVSSGHFCEFYIRDFGWCIDSLLELGHKDRVMKTLEYALSKYSKKRLTTTITPSGKCLDVFDYAPDSFAYLLRCLRVAKAKKLVEKYRFFLNKETRRFLLTVVDEDTGLVREDRHFSSMKDSSLKRGSCYDHTMLAVVCRELQMLGLANPFRNFSFYAKMLVKKFWNGKYFFDDVSKEHVVYGDNVVAPFWFNVVNGKDMLKKSIESARKAGLDKPFPLKYSSQKLRRMNFLTKYFAGGYQDRTVWMNIGPMFVHVVKRVDKKLAASYKKKYKEIIEKNSNFLELYDENGNPYKTPFYSSDEGMLWAANYLTL